MKNEVEIIDGEIEDSQFNERSPIPLKIRLRFALNDLGFKFVDDWFPSVIFNEDPEPLGRMTSWRETEHPGVTFYRQELPVSK